MKIIVRRIHNKKNVEIGAVVTADVNKITTAQEKASIEFGLINYAFDTLYRNTTLSLYSNIHSDNPSITVLKDINALPQETYNI